MLADDIASALPTIRAHAESRMTRSCVARPVVGVDADPNTGADVVEYGPAVYEGPCRLKPPGRAATEDVESGRASVTRSPAEWHIPHDSPRVPVGTVIFFDDLPAYRTTGLADGDDVTARRYPVEVVS